MEAVKERLILWIIHICLQQFRIDVMGCIKAEIREDHGDEALKGSKPICLEWLEEIMTDSVYRMSGNRCEFKVVAHLGHFLFDFDDGKVRKHWEDRPYRAMYRRASTAVAMLGRETKLAFRQRFWETLYWYYWILLYPYTNALMQTTKQGQRMWYLIEV